MLSFVALSRLDGCVFCCNYECRTTPTPTPIRDAEGRRVFLTQSGRVLIVVEGVPGVNGNAVATSLEPREPDNRPDLQIQSSQSLGNGDPAIPTSCPPGQFTTDGGIPGFAVPSFSEAPGVTEALTDFACRFDRGVSAAWPCTMRDASGDAKPINDAATAQFCDLVPENAKFPPGDSVLTVRLRDNFANPGPTAQIVVRVPTPAF